ncbi:MAG: hypothetical protein M5U09_25260 [Gammaproteobacteria bacterium]|nr:hypothetical protein [Gammaproteobacteria bacterium]
MRIETVPVPETLPPPRMSFALRRSRAFTRLLKLRLRFSAAARRAEAEYLAPWPATEGGGPRLEAWRLTAERGHDER